MISCSASKDCLQIKKMSSLNGIYTYDYAIRSVADAVKSDRPGGESSCWGWLRLLFGWYSDTQLLKFSITTSSETIHKIRHTSWLVSCLLCVTNKPFILSVDVLNVIMLSVLRLKVIMLKGIMLNVIVLNVVVMNVAAPLGWRKRT